MQLEITMFNKKTIFIVLIISVLFFPVSLSAEGRAAVILPVKTVPEDPVLAAGLYEIFNSVFLGSNYYFLIERRRINELLEELEFQLSDMVGENAIKVGKMLGAKILIAPSVSKIGSIYVLSIRFISAQSGIITMGNSWQSESAESLLRVISIAFRSLEDYLDSIYR